MKLKGLFALVTLGLIVFFYSCTKLNEPTELGDDLIPVVDNVNTFDTSFYPQVGYYPITDSSKHFIEDPMALGKTNDPVFGTTTADMYFNLSSIAPYGASPFNHKDSVVGIDSVVLQLAFVGAYGDTTQGSRVNIEVAEINKGNGFNDTTLYNYDHPGFSTGASLGTASFSVPQFKDSITLIRKRDTTKVANVLRVRLNNSLGVRLSEFDTSSTGAYRSDSLFRSAFRGLAVKTTGNSGVGTLAFFNVFTTGTALTVYYRTRRNGTLDTASAVFQHATYSQANSIMRTPGGEYLANIGKTSPQQLYIQSSPRGSYASIFIPELGAFPNKVIHRAELVVHKVPSTLDNIFTPPSRLFLDHKGASDTAAFLFDNDIPPTSDNSFDLGTFGGNLRSDNSYRFNITRYVQGLVTKKDRNDTLRLYAPLRSIVFSSLFARRVTVPVSSVIANGRVVLGNGNHPNPNQRLRLRIIYSNL